MPRAYSDLSTLISTKLSDTAVTEFVAGEINFQIEESLKEISEHFPHTVEVIYKIESRYGTPSSTSANNLVDTTKGQFLAADSTDEKVVYNATRQTWAVITSFSSTGQVGLSADIIKATSDQYYIFNKHSRNNRQVYIGDMIEVSEPVRAEYYTSYWPREWRNVRLEDGGRVLEVAIDFNPDDSDSDTSNYTARLDVLVEFRKPHILSQLTDWAGSLSASCLSGTTAMSMSSLQSAGTIEEGEEITVPGHRTVYVVTSDATIATNTVTVNFQPPFERTSNSTTVINFVKSSLTPQLEDTLSDLVAARLAINHGMKFANSISISGGNVWRNYTEWGSAKLAETLRKIRQQSTWDTYTSYSRG